MFLRSKTRNKDGKEHRYWSMVANRRVAGRPGGTAPGVVSGGDQRQPAGGLVPSIEVFDETPGTATQLALFPEDCPAPELACAVVQVARANCNCAARGNGGPAGWRASCGSNWTTFWQPRLPPSRKGTRWLNVLKTLVATG